jgi:hypothetical protein
MHFDLVDDDQLVMALDEIKTLAPYVVLTFLFSFFDWRVGIFSHITFRFVPPCGHRTFEVVTV